MWYIEIHIHIFFLYASKPAQIEEFFCEDYRLYNIITDRLSTIILNIHLYINIQTESVTSFRYI